MRINSKGNFVSTMFLGAMGVLVIYIFIQIFLPFLGILEPVANNMSNGATVLTLFNIVPVVVVGMFIWFLVMKFKESSE